MNRIEVNMNTLCRYNAIMVLEFMPSRILSASIVSIDVQLKEK